MKINVLLIGSASLLALSATGARAADPVMAIEPVTANYVEVCDAFGKGYFYIPGTETCLNIGGYVRFETKFGGIKTGSADDSDDPEADLEDLRRQNRSRVKEVAWGKVEGTGVHAAELERRVVRGSPG